MLNLPKYNYKKVGIFLSVFLLFIAFLYFLFTVLNFFGVKQVPNFTVTRPKVDKLSYTNDLNYLNIDSFNERVLKNALTDFGFYNNGIALHNSTNFIKPSNVQIIFTKNSNLAIQNTSNGGIVTSYQMEYDYSNSLLTYYFYISQSYASELQSNQILQQKLSAYILRDLYVQINNSLNLSYQQYQDLVNGSHQYIEDYIEENGYIFNTSLNTSFLNNLLPSFNNKALAAGYCGGGTIYCGTFHGWNDCSCSDGSSCSSDGDSCGLFGAYSCNCSAHCQDGNIVCAYTGSCSGSCSRNECASGGSCRWVNIPPPPKCGDGACVEADGENCSTCPDDCGDCPPGDDPIDTSGCLDESDCGSITSWDCCNYSCVAEGTDCGGSDGPVERYTGMYVRVLARGDNGSTISFRPKNDYPAVEQNSVSTGGYDASLDTFTTYRPTQSGPIKDFRDNISVVSEGLSVDVGPNQKLPDNRPNIFSYKMWAPYFCGGGLPVAPDGKFLDTRDYNLSGCTDVDNSYCVIGSRNCSSGDGFSFCEPNNYDGCVKPLTGGYTGGSTSRYVFPSFYDAIDPVLRFLDSNHWADWAFDGYYSLSFYAKECQGTNCNDPLDQTLFLGSVPDGYECVDVKVAKENGGSGEWMPSYDIKNTWFLPDGTCGVTFDVDTVVVSFELEKTPGPPNTAIVNPAISDYNRTLDKACYGEFKRFSYQGSSSDATGNPGGLVETYLVYRNIAGPPWIRPYTQSYTTFPMWLQHDLGISITNTNQFFRGNHYYIATGAVDRFNQRCSGNPLINYALNGTYSYCGDVRFETNPLIDTSDNRPWREMRVIDTPTPVTSASASSAEYRKVTLNWNYLNNVYNDTLGFRIRREVVNVPPGVTDPNDSGITRVGSDVVIANYWNIPAENRYLYTPNPVLNNKNYTYEDTLGGLPPGILQNVCDNDMSLRYRISPINGYRRSATSAVACNEPNEVLVLADCVYQLDPVCTNITATPGGGFSNFYPDVDFTATMTIDSNGENDIAGANFTVTDGIAYSTILSPPGNPTSATSNIDLADSIINVSGPEQNFTGLVRGTVTDTSGNESEACSLNLTVTKPYSLLNLSIESTDVITSDYFGQCDSLPTNPLQAGFTVNVDRYVLGGSSSITDSNNSVYSGVRVPLAESNKTVELTINVPNTDTQEVKCFIHNGTVVTDLPTYAYNNTREEEDDITVVVGPKIPSPWYQAVGGATYIDKNFPISDNLQPSALLANPYNTDITNRFFMANNTETFTNNSFYPQKYPYGSFGLVQTNIGIPTSEIAGVIGESFEGIISGDDSDKVQSNIIDFYNNIIKYAENKAQIIDGAINDDLERAEAGDVLKFASQNRSIGASSIKLNSPANPSGKEGGFLVITENNLTINSQELYATSSNYTIPVFYAGGDITISENTRALTGIFIANGKITVESNETQDDTRLVVNGSFIAKGNIELRRDTSFNNDYNNRVPTELFFYQPQLFLQNTPAEMQTTNIILSEID